MVEVTPDAGSWRPRAEAARGGLGGFGAGLGRTVAGAFSGAARGIAFAGVSPAVEAERGKASPLVTGSSGASAGRGMAIACEGTGTTTASGFAVLMVEAAGAGAGASFAGASGVAAGWVV